MMMGTGTVAERECGRERSGGGGKLVDAEGEVLMLALEGVGTLHLGLLESDGRLVLGTSQDQLL